MAAKEKWFDLSIHLLREGQSFGSALSDPAACDVVDLQLQGVNCKLFIRSTPAHLPDWVAWLSERVDQKAFGKAASVSAVLLVPSSSRLFGITFGYGRMLLSTDAAEERFGLKVVLNSIEAGSVFSVDKHSLDALGRHSRVQASKNANVRDFGIDVEQDLVKALTAIPKNQDKFGKRITGADTLRIATKSKPSGIPKLLKDLYDLSQEQTYLKEFPWVDQLREVSSRTMLGRLNTKLAESIAKGGAHDVRVAVPSLVDWNRIANFRYERIGDAFDHSELDLSHIEGVVQGRGLDWEDVIGSGRVVAIDDGGEPVEAWPLKRCLFGELRIGESAYVLSGGKWYEIKKDFVDRVNSYVVDNIPEFKGLPKYQDKDEAAYCVRVANEQQTWTHFDRKPLVYGGGYSRVEFCDLFRSSDGTLLHIKRYAGSAPLSHLFAQGLVSGEAFRSDRLFREKVNNKLPAAKKLDDVAVLPEKCQVVFGIVKARDLQLPFFAKVALRQAALRLESLTFSVAKAHIDVEERTAKAKRVRKRRGSN